MLFVVFFYIFLSFFFFFCTRYFTKLLELSSILLPSWWFSFDSWASQLWFSFCSVWFVSFESLNLLLAVLQSQLALEQGFWRVLSPCNSLSRVWNLLVLRKTDWLAQWMVLLLNLTVLQRCFLEDEHLTGSSWMVLTGFFLLLIHLEKPFPGIKVLCSSFDVKNKD